MRFQNKSETGLKTSALSLKQIESRQMSVTILNIERQVKGAVKNFLPDFFR